MLKLLRSGLTVREKKEMENLRAEVNNQKETLETQKLMMQYIAGMSDVYIPEEEEEDDVRDIGKTEN